MHLRNLAVWTAVALGFALQAAALTTPLEPWDPTWSGDEMNLYEIYNNFYGTSFASNADLDALQLPDELFNLAASEGTIEVRAHFARSPEIFGWYEPDGAGTINHALFNVTETGLLTGYSATVNSAGDFGFFMDPLGVRANPNFWYSEVGRNSGEDHFLVYRTPDPNVYFLAWEDLLLGTGDRDFNDLVLEFVGPGSVAPEPTSMLLLGIGISVMAALRLGKHLA